MPQGGARPVPWPGSVPSRTTGRPLSLSQPQEVTGQRPVGSSEPGRQPSTGVQPHATGRGHRQVLLPRGRGCLSHELHAGQASRNQKHTSSQLRVPAPLHPESRPRRLTTELSQDGIPTAGSLSHPSPPARPTGALPPGRHPTSHSQACLLLLPGGSGLRAQLLQSRRELDVWASLRSVPLPPPGQHLEDPRRKESTPPPSQYRPRGAGGGFCSPPKSREPGAASRPGHPTPPEKPRPLRQTGYSPLLSMRAPLWAGLGVLGLPRGAGMPGGGLSPEGGT